MKSVLFSVFWSLYLSYTGLAAHAIANGQLKNLPPAEQAVAHRVVSIRSILLHREKGGDYTENCTATVIAKNILLTAGHCQAIFPEGGKFLINDEEGYTAYKVKILSALLAPSNPNPPLLGDPHDLALILVKTDKGSDDVFSQKQRIPVAQSAVEHEKTSKVLIAGYGTHDLENGTINPMEDNFEAGYASFAKSDFGVFPPAWDVKHAEESPYAQYLEIAIIFKNFHLYERGSKVAAFSDKHIVANVNSIPESGIANSAIPLHGDSGSPAISFNWAGRPEVVGVFSANTKTMLPKNDITTLAIYREPAVDPFYSRRIVDLPENFLSQMLKDFKLMSTDGTATENYTVVATQLLTQVGAYSSVFEPTNAAFIKETTEALKRISIR
jgi:hypothetical protein